MNRFDANGLQYVWSSTSLNIAQECLYKYYLTYIEGWHAHRPSVHLLFGGWYAAALERFHHLIAEGIPREDALRQVVLKALSDTYGWESDHNLKNRSNLIRTIVWYIDHFDPDPLETITLADGTPAVELDFMFDLGEGQFWRGKIDRLVRYSGDIYVQDQKTTGSTPSTYYFEQYDPDTQLSGYAFVGKALYQVPVRGVIIDAAQVAVGFSRFERGFTFRTEAKLEEWYSDVMYWIGVAREATAKQHFPRNRTSCGNYGGCVFRSICSKSPEVRENFLRADFTKEAELVEGR